MLAKINWRGVFFTPTSTPYKVVENIHMLWMDGWIHHHVTRPLHVLVLYEVSQLNSRITGEQQKANVPWLRPKTHF
jgi:hypothetical protein